MAKRCFGFYNEDGEREVTMDLDKGQQELLSFLQDWGFLLDSIHIQDLGEVRQYLPYHNCPECGCHIEEITKEEYEKEKEKW